MLENAEIAVARKQPKDNPSMKEVHAKKSDTDLKVSGKFDIYKFIIFVNLCFKKSNCTMPSAISICHNFFRTGI